MVNRVKDWLKRKATTIVLFSYGIIIGTSAPLLLSRCTTGGASCANCGGFCSVALGMLPLVLVVTFRDRLKRAGQQVLAVVRRATGRQPG